jgi:iron(III) transport system substrate-binding protein
MQASPRVPTTDVAPLPGVPKLSDLKLVAYDILRWGNERERVVAEFNKLFPKYQ